MPMPPYRVACLTPGCPGEAAFKIAAKWSDGLTHELKTYALACADCVDAAYAAALTKQQACRLALGESLDEPEVVSGRWLVVGQKP